MAKSQSYICRNYNISKALESLESLGFLIITLCGRLHILSSWNLLNFHVQTAKVVVVAAERERNRLRFSEKEAEGEGQELAQKKAQLMVSSRWASYLDSLC